MRFPKLKIKLKLHTWLLIYYAFWGIISLLAFGWTTLFLRTYLADITSTETGNNAEVTTLSLPATVQINKFNTVIQNIENKTKRTKPDSWKNLFNP